MITLERVLVLIIVAYAVGMTIFSTYTNDNLKKDNDELQLIIASKDSLIKAVQIHDIALDSAYKEARVSYDSIEKTIKEYEKAYNTIDADSIERIWANRFGDH